MKGKDKVLSVRLENDVYEKFKEFCQERDLPASLLARHIIKDWIKQQESAKKARLTYKEADNNDRHGIQREPAKKLSKAGKFKC